MRKKIFLLAVVALLVGVFFFFQEEEKAIEKEIENFVAANLNQPYHIKELEQFPFVREATLTLTRYEREQARSLFRLVLIEPGQETTKQIDIPLVSVITRGSSKHEGDSFGFAHIVTHPELAGLREMYPRFPKEITDKTFRAEHFIDYDGSLRELCVVEPLDFQDSGSKTVAHIGGGQVRIDSSIFDREARELVARVEKMWLKEKNMAMEIRPFHLEGNIENDGAYTGKSSVIDLVVTDESAASKEEGVIHFSEGTYSGKIKRLEGINVNIGSSQAHFDVVSIKQKNVDAAFENIELKSGIHEAGDNLFDLKWSFSGKPTIALPPILPDGVDIQKIGLRYEVKKATPQLLNFGTGFAFSSDYVVGVGKKNPVLEKLLQILQQSETEFVFSAFLDEAKGKGEVKGNVVLSSYAKTLNVSDFSKSDAKKLFDARADLRLDKAVADVFNLTQAFLREPSQFLLKDDVFSSSVILQDGIVKVNGQQLR